MNEFETITRDGYTFDVRRDGMFREHGQRFWQHMVPSDMTLEQALDVIIGNLRNRDAGRGKTNVRGSIAIK